jgi:hypothetical protein
MNNLYASSLRHGKIARLPHTLRDQINRRLQNSEQDKTLLPWLNNLPEVKTILAAEFNSRSINKQNLSDWKKGGFREWLIQQQALEFARNLDSIESPNSQTAINFNDKLSHWLAVQYAAATCAFASENSKNQWNRLREFCADIARLRRGDFHSQLLQIKRDWLALERKNADFQDEQRFTEWAKDRGLLKEPKGGLSKEAMEAFKEEMGIIPRDPNKPSRLTPEARAEFREALNQM